MGFGFGGELGKQIEAMREKPELDKTKEALKELKKSVEEGREVTIETAINSIFDIFKVDMGELSITDPAKIEEHWGPIREKLEADLIAETGEITAESIEELKEKKALDKFITDLENIAGLRKIIDDKSPKNKAESWVTGLKEKFPNFEWGFGWIAKTLADWANEEKKGNKEKDTMFGKMARTLSGWLGTDEEEDKPATPGPAAPAAAVAATSQPEAAKEQPKQNLDELKKPELRSIAERFAGKFQINLETLESDLEALKKSGLKKVEIDELINTGLSKTGRFKKIGKAINSVHEKPFVFRLADIRLQKESDFSNEKIAQIEKAIKTEIKTDSDSLRKFLDGVLKAPSKIEAAIELNKKSASA